MLNIAFVELEEFKISQVEATFCKGCSSPIGLVTSMCGNVHTCKLFSQFATTILSM